MKPSSTDVTKLARLVSRPLGKKGGWYAVVGLALVLAVNFIPDADSISLEPSPSPSVAASGLAAAPSESRGRVYEVVDGDTFKVETPEGRFTVRLIGVDTPETVDPRNPVQCFGKEASAAASELLLNKEVALFADATQDDTDRYGRLLRYVTLPGDIDPGGYLIARGYAYEYTYEKPYQRQGAYRAAQKGAELSAAGLWAKDACSGRR